jgi:hypothetical protein
MDPNETLRQLEELLTGAEPDDEAAAELQSSLVNWLRMGGFAPDWNACPRATEAMRMYRRQAT